MNITGRYYFTLTADGVTRLDTWDQTRRQRPKDQAYTIDQYVFRTDGTVAVHTMEQVTPK